MFRPLDPGVDMIAVVAFSFLFGILWYVSGSGLSLFLLQISFELFLRFDLSTVSSFFQFALLL